MNILFCSCGRRAELIQYVMQSLNGKGKVVAADCSDLAPALYVADSRYIVPPIDSPYYIDEILRICSLEAIDVVTTLIDPEIELLSRNRDRFSQNNVTVLAPSEATAELCFDKFKMYEHLIESGIPTVLTFGDMDSFYEAYSQGKIQFPVFIKPRKGSGSVGAQKVDSLGDLRHAMECDSSLIIQEYIPAGDLDVDAYVDIVSHRLVAVFAKRKLSTTIGGANKTISFKNDRLLEAIEKVVGALELRGPVDMDFFSNNGEFVISEVNPRFGGAYLHAYRAGVDFVRLIDNNVRGVANEPCFNNYENGSMMLMYDSVIYIDSNDKRQGFDC